MELKFYSCEQSQFSMVKCVEKIYSVLFDQSFHELKKTGLTWVLRTYQCLI